VVRNCARARHWVLVTEKEDASPWHVFWMDVGIDTGRLITMQPFQRINHWPGACARARAVRRVCARLATRRGLRTP
jgi:hypothetical protein